MEQQISDSELLLMRLIWSKDGKALFAQIMEELSKQGTNWKPNTVLTFLSRLVEKGYLSTKKMGRRNEYIACITEEAYTAGQTITFLDRYYEGNARGLVNALLSRNCLTQEDMEELSRFWNTKGGET